MLFFREHYSHNCLTCSIVSWTNFPTSLPTETDKVWTITLSKTSDIRLIIHCNNKEVLNVVLSDTICGESDWIDWWSKDMEKIYFDFLDTASDYYRQGKLNACKR